jgi:hypothetical protein
MAGRRAVEMTMFHFHHEAARRERLTGFLARHDAWVAVITLALMFAAAGMVLWAVRPWPSPLP